LERARSRPGVLRPIFFETAANADQELGDQPALRDFGSLSEACPHASRAAGPSPPGSSTGRTDLRAVVIPGAVLPRHRSNQTCASLPVPATFARVPQVSAHSLPAPDGASRRTNAPMSEGPSQAFRADAF